MLYNDPSLIYARLPPAFGTQCNQPTIYIKKIHISSLCLLLNLITKEFLVCSHTDTNQQL